MSQFLVLIRSEGNPMTVMSQDEQREHVAAVREFVAEKSRSGSIKSALPLEINGLVLSGASGSISEFDFVPEAEPVAGYYLVEASDLAAAANIAKRDPRFQGRLAWRMEIRPILVVPGISD